jgi:hypothetical protein
VILLLQVSLTPKGVQIDFIKTTNHDNLVNFVGQRMYQVFLCSQATLVLTPRDLAQRFLRREGGGPHDICLVSRTTSAVCFFAVFSMSLPLSHSVGTVNLWFWERQQSLYDHV